MGRLTPSVGRLTVLHAVGVVRLQDAWSDRSRLRRYIQVIQSVEVVCVRLVGVVRLQDHRFDHRYTKNGIGNANRKSI